MYIDFIQSDSAGRNTCVKKLPKKLTAKKFTKKISGVIKLESTSKYNKTKINSFK